jgi:hypothetical protein
MVGSNTAVAKVLLFPVPNQGAGPTGGDLIYRILESKDDLLFALELLRKSHDLVLAEKPLKDVEEILAQVEGLLKYH